MTTVYDNTREEGAKVVDDAIGEAPEGAEERVGQIDDPEHPVEPVEPPTEPLEAQGSPQQPKPLLYAPTRAITILMDPEGIKVGIIGTVTVEELQGAAKALMMGAQQAMQKEAMAKKARMDALMGKGPGMLPGRRIV